MLNSNNMKVRIKHKFRKYKVDKNTRILIIGTFNPDVINNEAEFFYGRSRNYLWSLLPAVFNEKELKKESLDKKIEFIKKYSISFTDLIEEVEVEKGEENNYKDDYIDSRVLKWNNIIENLLKNSKIKEVYFTRRSFSAIPNIKRKIFEIEKYCREENIKFRYLITPSRFINAEKIEDWKRAFWAGPF